MGTGKKEIGVSRVMQRFGDGRNSSVREISRVFGIAESTLRGMMAHSARLGSPWSRDFALHRIDVLAARLEQCVHELAQLRRELADRAGWE